MTTEQWEEVKNCFHQALQQPAEKRKEFLSRACSCDAVRTETERLLEDHGAASEFLRRPLLDETQTLPFDRLTDSEGFRGTQRFTIRKCLGEGTFGVVYRVFDKERNADVALKKMRRFDPAHLLRFKAEFRSLVDLTHPNLLQLYELFGENQQWFFTMELIKGTDFTSHVRPGNVLGKWDSLRAALRQLTAGVQALHSSGRLHRDLKPSNVLVAEDGRVVILDFGLVKEFESRPIEQSQALIGSPAYMSPEQAGGGAINEASDWYAVGVMLYRSLTGQLPFAGTWNEVLERKQTEPAPDCRDLSPFAPEDLTQICRYLLERDPELRLQGTAMLQEEQRHGSFGKERLDGARESREEFVGRRRELILLRARFSALANGSCQVALLKGQSGIGKTSLVSQFLKELKNDCPGVVILKGQCRESESVAYKALDPIIDELVRRLRALPAHVSMTLLPRNPELLKHLFPVFGELDIFSSLPKRERPDQEAQEFRPRAFEALRELFGRMTDRAPVVIWIDDLQWADLDSVAFLSELIVPKNAPALLLVLSFRSEEADSHIPLLVIRSFQERIADADSLATIEIQGLSEDESRDFLHLMHTDARLVTEKETEEIVREAGGSPLLLSELRRFAAIGISSGDSSKRPAGVLISDMIRHRASNLSTTSRRLLEAAAVAGEPITKALLYRCVGLEDGAVAQEVGLLIRDHLLRVTGDSQATKVEPFHDKVREASLLWLSAAELQSWHARIATVLRAEANMEAHRLLRHYLGSGDLAAAFEAALAAAETAETALAFDQAARFYLDAVETGQADEQSEARLHRKRADALAKAGRGYESAQGYLQAARCSVHQDPEDMQRKAAEQLMRSGHLEEGTGLFADLLRKAGVRVPRKRVESLLRMLALRSLIRIRGLRWRSQSEADLPAETLRKLDLLWSGAMALVSTDTITGSYLQALHMLTALQAGEPSRLALSLSFGAVYESMGGTREYQHGRKLIGLAQNVAQRLNDSYLLAVTYGCWAGVDFLSGRIEDGLSHSRISLEGLEQAKRHTRAWELGTFKMLLIWFLGWGGRIHELSAVLPAMAEEARSRGDIYTSVSLRCCGTSHLVELAGDNPEKAIAEITNTLKQWRKTSYDLPHFYATYATAECLLYQGKVEEARQRLLDDWQSIRGSLFTRKSQLHRLMLFYLRGRTALAVWQMRPDAHNLRSEIEQYAKRLSQLCSPWADALSNLLQAGVLKAGNRNQDASRLLGAAEEILRQQDLSLFAAAVLRCRGELEGEGGMNRIKTADAFMKGEYIHRPDRMTAMILPGRWQP